MEVKCLLKTAHPEGKAPLATFQLKYSQTIHPQVLTHRVFSRNSMSNRAVPVRKMIQRIRDGDMFIPSSFRANCRGMVPKGLGDVDQELERREWRISALKACDRAARMAERGVHKETVNRLLMPFSFTHTILTTDSLNNFGKLRCHGDTQEEFHQLADEMRVQYHAAPLSSDPLHLPYLNDIEKTHPLAKMISAARCCRVSYLNHDKTYPSVEQDLALAQSLAENGHWSPFEHIAWPHVSNEPDLTGNFKGWNQYRKTFENESGEEYVF